MFYWPNNCAVAVLPIITLLAAAASLVMAHGSGRWIWVRILQKVGLTLTAHVLDRINFQGRFGMDQISLWMFWTGQNVH